MAMHPAIESFLERPLWQKAGAWALSLAFLGYCVWQFLLASLWEENAKLGDKITGLKTTISQEKRIAEELPRFKQEVANLEIKLKFALQELPDERQVEELLASISTLARDAGLIVNLFKPMPRSSKDFYEEVPVQISVEGTYHQIASFFDEVGRLPRIVNINQISVREPKVGESQVTVKGDCVSTAFRFIPESERIKSPDSVDKRRRRK